MSSNWNPPRIVAWTAFLVIDGKVVFVVVCGVGKAIKQCDTMIYYEVGLVRMIVVLRRVTESGTTKSIHAGAFYNREIAKTVLLQIARWSRAVIAFSRC